MGALLDGSVPAPFAADLRPVLKVMKECQAAAATGETALSCFSLARMEKQLLSRFGTNT